MRPDQGRIALHASFRAGGAVEADPKIAALIVRISFKVLYSCSLTRIRSPEFKKCGLTFFMSL